MFCPQCGAQIADHLKFCTKCGTPVSSAMVSQAPESEGFQLTKSMVLGAIGAVAMVMVAIGSALPWATASTGIFSVSKGGLSVDGQFTMGLAVIGLVLFMVATFVKMKLPFIVGLIASILILGIASYDVANVTNWATNVGEGVSASVGVGLVICLIGGILGLVTGVIGISRIKVGNRRQGR